MFGWTIDERTSFQLLDIFVAGGFNLIDTGNVYSCWAPGNVGGESETIIGRWLARRSGARRQILIATKVGAPTPAGGGGLSTKYILSEVEKSLHRLNTEYVDIYQSHIDDMSTPLEETLEAHAKLIRDGKVRSVGASNYSAARLGVALEVSANGRLPRYESLEVRYNLLDRNGYEGDLAAKCQQERVGVLAYFALASGFLTGKHRSEADFQRSSRGAFVSQIVDTTEAFGRRGRRILAALEQVARALDATPAQLSLAWLLARGVTAPIASATTQEQLEQLMKAVNIVLPPEALTALTDASAYSH